MTAPVMIMAGGTGGHIFPALAVAESLKARKVPVVWLGSKGGMETRLVPAKGYPLIELSVSGLRGKGVMTLLSAPFKLIFALAQAVKALLKYRPQAVLGLGGFASGPGGLAAWLLRTPLFIHEQNSIPGMTNRWLARLSRSVMEAFPHSFKSSGISALTVGNPVRAEIIEIPDPQERLGNRSGAIRVLVIGGSLGALKLNNVVPEALAKRGQDLEIWHQTGERHLAVTEQLYKDLKIQSRVEPFIDEMSQAYQWADLIVARSGALTISEIAQVGIASVLVPYPHAVDDHQTANGMNLVERKAAKLIPDAELTVERLDEVLQEILSSRANLLEMAQAATTLRMPDAANTVAQICLGEHQ